MRGQITAVGISVMADYRGELTEFLPGICVHAYVGLQIISSIDALQTLRAEHQLESIIVVALRTNRPPTPTLVSQMLPTLSGASSIALANKFIDRAWQNPNKQLIFATAKAHPDIVVTN